MPKFKKPKVTPIVAFDDLKLNVANKKYIDLSHLKPEQFKELMNKALKIVQKSEGAIIAKKVDGTPFVSSLARTSKEKNKYFSFPEPNPIHIYYQIANLHLEKAEQAKTEFLKMDGGHPQEFTAFVEFAKEIFQGIVFLTMTLEGFINQLPEEETVYKIDGEDKTKQSIEWMNLTDKMRKAVVVITGIDIYSTDLETYEILQSLINIRNELIHLKKTQSTNFTFYQKLYKRLLDLPLLNFSEAVFKYIEKISPGFFELEMA